MAPNSNFNDVYDLYGSVEFENDDFIILNDEEFSNDIHSSNIVENDNAIIISDDFLMVEDIDNTINCSDDVDDYLNSSEDFQIIESDDFLL